MSEEKVQELPKIDFFQFIGGLAYQAQVFLGIYQNPMTNQYERDLEKARYHTDLMSMLEEKTKGNLSAEEENFLKKSLTELRLRFVFESKEQEKIVKTEPPKEESSKA